MEHYKISYLGELRTECVHASGASLTTDAPKDNQGKGEAFSPTDLLAVSLGSCMLTIMAIAARRLGCDLKGTTVEVEKEMSQTAPRRIGKLIVRFRSPARLSKEFQQKLEQAAVNCPVHFSLHPDIRQEIDFIWGI
jgi:putative redox protein